MKHTKFNPHMTDRQAGFGLAYLVFQLVFLPSLLVQLTARWALREGQINFVYYLVNFLFCFGIYRSFLKCNLQNAGRRLWQFLLAVVLGFLGYKVSNYLLSALTRLIFPSFSNMNDASISSMLLEDPLLMGLGVCVLVPFAEECMFRGLIFGKLRPKSALVAYCASTLFFCAIHVLGYWGSYPFRTLLICFLQYVPTGLILARSYEYSGSIFAPMVIHAAVNTLSFLSLR